MVIRYRDKRGKEIDLMTWGKLLEQPEYKIIKQQTLNNGLLVSTVWLGLNHNFFQVFQEDKGLYFETMVFNKKKQWIELLQKYSKLGDEVDCVRYETLKEAKAGHKVMIKKWES